MANVTLYHYTDKTGADAIGKSEKINPSPKGRTAAFGPGVYLNSLSPKDFTKGHIAENNYDDASLPVAQEKAGKIDYYVKVKLPSNVVDKCKGDRDVYRHEGGIDLTKYEHVIKKK